MYVHTVGPTDVLKGLLHTRFGLSPSLCWVFRGAAAAGGGVVV